MKKTSVILLGTLVLSACSSDNDSDQEKETQYNEINGTTYEFEEYGDGGWAHPNSYQLTVDDSFELRSDYEVETYDEQMFFWHKPSADDYTFELETTQEILEEQVPIMEMKPVNKNQYVFNQEYANDAEVLMGEISDEEKEEVEEKVKKIVNDGSGDYLEDMKESIVEEQQGETTTYTAEDEYDIKPFTYMIESESENGALHYNLIGEAEDDYIRASISVPGEEEEEQLETLLNSLHTLTYNEDEFKDDAVLEEPDRLSYEPEKNLQGSYPEGGYSFKIPEAATFRYSFPVYHTYRYTFDTLYKESIEKEHFSLHSSELVVRAAQEQNARNREDELRHRKLEDFVPFQHDYARSVTYLHDEDFDTGIFTTGVRVKFDGYEEYWFLKEADGQVYEVTFDLAFEAEEYDELLDSYLKVVRSFELIDAEGE
ncbi:hypothetical protein [Halobacillus sp. B23F22_1]|uniref:hypothetical protein n=1 Tax=Halobacillus sp. B23F22_1 TaxID=3459514 RepID=UPI00373F350E